LTEAVFHLGRLQNERQAVRLVKRYKKYSEEKGKAEESLATLLNQLDRTQPQHRKQLVLDMKAELTVLAYQRECVLPQQPRLLVLIL
jgi:hypothetical protein